MHVYFLILKLILFSGKMNKVQLHIEYLKVWNSITFYIFQGISVRNLNLSSQVMQCNVNLFSTDDIYGTLEIAQLRLT